MIKHNKHNIQFYVGTYTDDAIIKQLQEHNPHLIRNMNTQQIKEEILNKGRVKNGLVYFFAENIAKAFKHAKDMDLKNFAEVSPMLYEKGKHYR